MPWHSPFPFPIRTSGHADDLLDDGVGIVAVRPNIGAFGEPRKKHMHEGLDLYAPWSTPVLAVEDGAVVAVTPLRGGTTRDDYWRDMEAVLVEGKSGLVVYSEFAPLKTLKPAQMVKAGEQVGTLYPEGYTFRPTAKDGHGTHAFMHLELHTTGTRLPSAWQLGKPQPKTLLDPTPHLLAIAVKK